MEEYFGVIVVVAVYIVSYLLKSKGVEKRPGKRVYTRPLPPSPPRHREVESLPPVQLETVKLSRKKSADSLSTIAAQSEVTRTKVPSRLARILKGKQTKKEFFLIHEVLSRKHF